MKNQWNFPFNSLTRSYEKNYSHKKTRHPLVTKGAELEGVFIPS